MRYDVNVYITVDNTTALEAELAVIDFLAKHEQEFYINNVQIAQLQEQLELPMEFNE